MIVATPAERITANTRGREGWRHSTTRFAAVASRCAALAARSGRPLAFRRRIGQAEASLAFGGWFFEQRFTVAEASAGRFLTVHVRLGSADKPKRSARKAQIVQIGAFPVFDVIL